MSKVAHVEGPGLRTGAGGQVLSSGCSDLDQLCGGGLALGSLVIILEDQWRAHSSTILSYFMAEGIVCQQQMMYFCNDLDRKALANRLPAHAKKGSTQDKDAARSQQASETELNIAWQYRRYIKPAAAQSTGGRPQQSAFRPKATTSTANRSAKASPWAHQFDLSKRCQEDLLERASGSITCLPEQPGVPDASVFRSAVTAATELVARVQRAAAGHGNAPPPTPEQAASLDRESSDEASPSQAADGGPVARGPRPGGVQTAADALPTFSPKSVGRIAVEGAGGVHWPDCGGSSGERGLLSMLMGLKAAVRGTRCVAMVTVAADLYSASAVAQVLHCADVALRLRSLADDAELVRLSAEPHSAAGLVHVCKFSVPGCISLPVCEPMLLLLRQRRTRVSLVPIEIDPNAEMDFAEAPATLANTAASVLCHPGRPQPALDF